MAKCEFPDYLGLVHGTISKSVYYDKGVKHTRRVIATVRNGKQHIRIQDERQRATPPSEAELRNRALFQKATQMARQLYKDSPYFCTCQYQKMNGTYNGKKYKSVMGFTIASTYAVLRKEQAEQNNSEQHETSEQPA